MTMPSLRRLAPLGALAAVALGGTLYATRTPTKPATVIVAPPPRVSVTHELVSVVVHMEASCLGSMCVDHAGIPRCAPLKDRACFDAQNAALVKWGSEMADAHLPLSIYAAQEWVDAASKYGSDMFEVLSKQGHELSCHLHNGDAAAYEACFAALAKLAPVSRVYGGATVTGNLPSLWAIGHVIQGIDAEAGHATTDQVRYAGIWSALSAQAWETPAPGYNGGVVVGSGTGSLAKAAGIAGNYVAKGLDYKDEVSGTPVPIAPVSVMVDPATVGSAVAVGVSPEDTSALILTQLQEAVTVGGGLVEVVTVSGAVKRWVDAGRPSWRFAASVGTPSEEQHPF